ncbi:hypothetical protein F4825DRAFT_420847 [Nemania diffusa]|nr:hypothetical protein F4825DRAFT_420847 [Nemania diffusa]
MEEVHDYRALYEQERRAREEAERLIEEAKLETERARQSERQTARFNEYLQQELQQQRRQTNPQSLEAYLAQVSRLQAHAVRLLPQRPSGRIPPHVQAASAQSSSSQPTTSGRTDIKKKFYPLRLRLWTAFPDEVQRAGFARIYATLHSGEDEKNEKNEKNGLPSRFQVQNDEETLVGQLPLEALEQEGGLNAIRTHDFLNAVLLTPTSKILNQYFNQDKSSDNSKKIFFDAAVQSVVRVSQSNSSSPRVPRKVQPDCSVLYMDPNDSLSIAASSVRLIAVGEHKPCHAIRAASVTQMIRGPLPEDFIIRLARQALARLESKPAGQPATAAQASGSEQDIERGRGWERESELTSRPTALEAGAASSKTQKIDKQTYFAYALTQAYHYMLVSGVEYGYLSNAEVLVFLRIREDDAASLYYHVALFPIPSPATAEDAGSFQLPQAVAEAPFPAPGDPVGELALGALPISQMGSFCDLAIHAARRSPSWVLEQTRRLAQFPNLPSGVAAQYDRRPSSRLGRRRRSDDNDDSDDNNDNNNDSNSRRQLRAPSHHGHHVRTASPLQQQITARSSPGPRDDDGDVNISTAFLSTYCDMRSRPRPSRRVASPTLPYCTQTCLLGLVQKGPLDPRCPNHLLHKTMCDNGTDGHPLTSLHLAQRIRDQLFDTPEVDCQYLVSRRGAIGYPFKLTVTGFGYTFIGKGVQDDHGRRLIHESRIYQALQPLQGSVIPVHLGLIQLHVGYPIQDQFLILPYMMLLAYAGESIARSLLTNEEDEERGKEIPPEIAHHRAEAVRTQQELESWGLDDDDDNVTNVRWCSEVGRAMRIDFDRAYLTLPLRRQKRPLQFSQTSQTAQTASSHSTPTTPTAMEDTFLDLIEQQTQNEPVAKKQKFDHDSNVAGTDVAASP